MYPTEFPPWLGVHQQFRAWRGYDAGKKIKGRKRHIAVDSEGNELTVFVHSEGIQDRVAARAVLTRSDEVERAGLRAHSERAQYGGVLP